MHLYVYGYVCICVCIYETICVEVRGKYEVTSFKVVCVCIHTLRGERMSWILYNSLLYILKTDSLTEPKTLVWQPGSQEILLSGPPQSPDSMYVLLLQCFLYGFLGTKLMFIQQADTLMTELPYCANQF